MSLIDVEETLAQLTLEEKASLLAGESREYICQSQEERPSLTVHRP